MYTIFYLLFIFFSIISFMSNKRQSFLPIHFRVRCILLKCRQTSFYSSLTLLLSVYVSIGQCFSIEFVRVREEIFQRSLIYQFHILYNLTQAYVYLRFYENLSGFRSFYFHAKFLCHVHVITYVYHIDNISYINKAKHDII